MHSNKFQIIFLDSNYFLRRKKIIYSGIYKDYRGIRIISFYEERLQKSGNRKEQGIFNCIVLRWYTGITSHSSFYL